MPESSEGVRRPGRPANTSREEIVAAALDLSRTVGFDGLSLRLVAERLGISPMGIYRHLPDKRALLEAAADAALAEVTVPRADEVDPLASLRELGHRLRRVLLRYPGAAGYALAYGPVWPSALRITERSLEALTAAGYDKAGAARAYVAFAHFVIGRAHIETSLAPPGEDDESTTADVHPRLETLDVTGFPAVAAAASSIRGLNPAAQFSYELDRLLDGMRAELGARGSPAP